MALRIEKAFAATAYDSDVLRASDSRIRATFVDNGRSASGYGAAEEAVRDQLAETLAFNLQENRELV